MEGRLGTPAGPPAFRLCSLATSTRPRAAGCTATWRAGGWTCGRRTGGSCRVRARVSYCHVPRAMAASPGSYVALYGWDQGLPNGRKRAGRKARCHCVVETGFPHEVWALSCPKYDDLWLPVSPWACSLDADIWLPPVLAVRSSVQARWRATATACCSGTWGRAGPRACSGTRRRRPNRHNRHRTRIVQRTCAAQQAGSKGRRTGRRVATRSPGEEAQGLAVGQGHPDGVGKGEGEKRRVAGGWVGRGRG